MPSSVIKQFFSDIKEYLPNNVLIVNLSKGIFKRGRTIIDYLSLHDTDKFHDIFPYLVMDIVILDPSIFVLNRKHGGKAFPIVKMVRNGMQVN